MPRIPRQGTVSGKIHTLVFLVIVAGWLVGAYFSVVRMRATHQPLRIREYIFTILWQWLLVGYIAWGAKKHGTSLRELVGGKWNSVKDVFKDVATAIGFWFVSIIILATFSVAFHIQRDRSGFDVLRPQNRLELYLWFLTATTAGICEEIIFRGYLQKQFSAWTGNIAAGMVISAIIFGAGHLYQGWKSAIVIGIYGLLFSILAENQKSLRPGMISHAWNDIVAGGLLRMLRK